MIYNPRQDGKHPWPFEMGVPPPWGWFVHSRSQCVVITREYMGVHKYVISLRVFNFCANEWNIKLNMRREIPYLQSSHVYYIKKLMTTFYHFSKISQTLSEDFWRFSKSCAQARQMFENISKNFRRLPNISEHNWRFLRKNRWCIDHTAKHLRTLKGICTHTNGKNMLFSRVKKTCLQVKAHLVFHCCLCNKMIHLPVHLSNPGD